VELFVTKLIANPEPELPRDLNGEWQESEPAGASRQSSAVKLQLLWRERRFIVRVAALGAVLSLALAFALPMRFVSSARLMPPDNQSASGLAMLAALNSKTGGLGGLAGDLLGMKSSGALFIGILRSRTVQERLVQEFHLQDVYWFTPTLESACGELNDNTQVSEDRKSGIITVAVTDSSAQRAASLASAYIRELNRLVTQLNTSAAGRERAFIEQRLQVVREDLDRAAKAFSEFASKNTAIDIKEQGRAMVEGAATLQGQLIAAQSELEGLRQIYTDSNVRVRALHARIGELQAQLNKLGGGPPASSAPAGTEKSLYPSIRELPVLGVTYAKLFRDLKVQETVFELLTQQYELAKVQEAKEVPSVKVLDEPRVPERKSFPPRTLILFLGTSFSFAFGSAWILGKSRWDAVDNADPGKQLALEVGSAARGRWEIARQSINALRQRGSVGKASSRGDSEISS